MKQFNVKLCVVAVIILFGLSTAWAGYGPENLEPVRLPHQIVKATGSQTGFLDIYEDTLYYDDGYPYQWFGGLTDFGLATRFTPTYEFELQGATVHLNYESGDPIVINLYVHENQIVDDIYYPGDILWEGTLTYNSGPGWSPGAIDPPILFSGGSDFWLRIVSEGPPFESYDVTPTTTPNGSRSMTYFEPWGGYLPDPSPGDNFIRAMGDYVGIWDVSVDEISHEGNYFILNESPAELPVHATITNQGDHVAPGGSVTVRCINYDINGVPISQQQYAFPDPLDPGESRVVDFISEIMLDGRYECEVIVIWDMDEDDTNDSQRIEFQVYTPTDELRYDEEPNLAASYTMNLGDGFAMRFDPHLDGSSFMIDEIRIGNTVVPGFISEAVISVWNDEEGAPHEMIWSYVENNPGEGWNDYSVEVTTTGAFYVAYSFMTYTTALLNFDNPLKSNQAWMQVSDEWNPDPMAYDWCMRATISVEPDVSVNLEPAGSVYIPPTGGTLEADFETVNNSLVPLEVDMWWDVRDDGQVVMGPDLIEENYTLSGFGAYETLLAIAVPDWLPGGRYSLNTYAGDWDNPDDPLAMDFFYFFKTETSGGPVKEWNGTRTLILGKEENTLELPEDFSLAQNFPNPFNPVTKISFGLPENEYVNLVVFDILGNCVSTLVNQELNAGMYEIDFDASHLAAGVYLYRLKAGEFSAVNKMILMK